MNYNTLIFRTLLINTIAIVAFVSLITINDITITLHNGAILALLGFILFHNFFNYSWLKKTANENVSRKGKLFTTINTIVVTLFFLSLTSISPLFTFIHGELEAHHLETISLIHHVIIYCFFAFIVGQILSLYMMIKNQLK